MASKKTVKKNSKRKISVHRNGSLVTSPETKNLIRIAHKASQMIEREAKQRGLTRIIGKHDGIYESRPDGTLVRIKKVSLKTHRRTPQKFRLQ